MIKLAFCDGNRYKRTMDAFLDIFLAVGHGGFTLFNLLGWIWKKARKVHLMILSATFISWFGLGIWYGWGYCPCTDWHWQVKYRLGQTDLPASYITHYLNVITGLDWSPVLVDAGTVFFAVLAFVLSLWFNRKDARV